jgi:hypothetical protein
MCSPKHHRSGIRLSWPPGLANNKEYLCRSLRFCLHLSLIAAVGVGVRHGWPIALFALPIANEVDLPIIVAIAVAKHPLLPHQERLPGLRLADGFQHLFQQWAADVLRFISFPHSVSVAVSKPGCGRFSQRLGLGHVLDVSVCQCDYNNHMLTITYRHSVTVWLGIHGVLLILVICDRIAQEEPVAHHVTDVAIGEHFSETIGYRDRLRVGHSFGVRCGVGDCYAHPVHLPHEQRLASALCITLVEFIMVGLWHWTAVRLGLGVAHCVRHRIGQYVGIGVCERVM